MSALFSPLQLRGCTLPNRIVVSPMCQYVATEGRADDWHQIHLGSLSLSGAGMLMIEATAVERRGRITPGCLGLWDDATQQALVPVLASIRRFSGTRVVMQLAHAGRKASSEVPWRRSGKIGLSDGGWACDAPSALAPAPDEPAPMALDDAGLLRIRDAFASAARRAAALGIDGLEVHAAHGYLLHQFLSPLSNQRSDRYGGSLDNRMRFPLEVFEAVRAAFPDDKPVGMRVSATDWVEGGWDLPQSITLAHGLKLRGIDWIDVSSGGISPAQRIAAGPLYQVPFASEIKAATGVTTMAVGLITQPRKRKASSPRGWPTWWHWPARCCTTRAGAGTPLRPWAPRWRYRLPTCVRHRASIRSSSCARRPDRYTCSL